MMIACIYITCKKINLPRTLPELSKIVNGNEIFAARCYRLLSREFKITFVPSDPAMFLHKIVSESQISEITAHKALDILISVRKNEKFVGKDSLSVAAVCFIYSMQKRKRKSFSIKNCPIGQHKHNNIKKKTIRYKRYRIRSIK